MSAESNFSFTTKVNGDLFTVRGDDWATFANNVDTVTEHAQLVAEKLGLLSAIGAAAVVVNVGPPESPVPAPVQPTAAPGWGSAPAPTAPPAAFAAATVPSCQHGPRTPRSGASAKGPWRAWFCPTPKGTVGQCEALWVDRKSPEWDAFPA